MEKVLAVIAGFALEIILFALIAWGVSVLVSYILDIDFGFWKAVGSLILLSIVGSFFKAQVVVNK